MLTDPHHFPGDNVPVRQFGDHGVFPRRQAAGGQLVFPNEVRVTDHDRLLLGRSAHLQDGELAVDSAGRSIAALIQCQMRDRADIARCRDGELHTSSAQLAGALNSAIDIVTED